MTENLGRRFDRLPAAAAEREVEGRATREEVVEWWRERFGIPAETFDGYTFWEKGAGKIWILRGEVASPIEIEALGMTFLRTRQEHWKPTTNAAQRFGGHATRNVIELTREQSERFVRGEDQELDWDGDWGYLIAAHDLDGMGHGRSEAAPCSRSPGSREPLGVGVYLHGELRSHVPKGRRREL